MISDETVSETRTVSVDGDFLFQRVDWTRGLVANVA